MIFEYITKNLLSYIHNHNLCSIVKSCGCAETHTIVGTISLISFLSLHAIPSTKNKI